MAHDLRSPLTTISGYVEAMRDRVLKPTPARFEMMYVETQHLRRLVDDLRTLSLTDAGELHMDRQAIPPQDLPHVFDRFYRGDSARSKDGGESGLGLAIAKAIVEAHGGTISVDSTLGVGTTFTMALN